MSRAVGKMEENRSLIDSVQNRNYWRAFVNAALKAQ
jgi:hypothetical protein